MRIEDLFENALQLFPEAGEKTFDGAADLLLHRALVDRTQPARRVVAILEVLHVHRTAVHRAQVRHRAQLDLAQARRDLGWSKPTQTPTTSDEVKPTNQASLNSLVVPVLPPDGKLTPQLRAAAAVPRSRTSSSIETL